MAIDLSNPINSSKLLAAVDMGTNSFKMLVVRADPNGKFLSIDRFKEPVVLGRGMLTNSPSISPESQIRAISALQKFGQILQRQQVGHTKIVATSAVREAANKGEFLSKIKEEMGYDVEVLSGEEEARFVYIGVLQFLPVYNKTVLAIDIGGGSTEFVIGKQGKVIFANSLKLGHVTLTDGFVKNGDIVNMRNHIRSIIHESGIVEKIQEVGFEISVGSSGTIRSIEKAVSLGYGRELANSVVSFGEFRRDWRFNREDLGVVVEKLCDLDAGGDEEMRRVGFFKRRSEFILAGAVLLLEIFEILKIDEMEVSEYALGEGVIAETLASCCEGYDINANARWRSVTKLATRFNTGKRMKLAALSVGIAKEIFEGLRKCDELTDHQINRRVSLDEKDLEYLEAACLLHNIGLFIGKKGYHKHSYHIIKNGEHLHGYSTEEVELIALLARHHRKKFPKCDHASLHGFPKEVKEKFRILCAILRISVAVQHCQCMTFNGLETSKSQEGFKLVFNEITDLPLPPGNVQPTVEDVQAELKPELNHFREVVQMELLVAVSSSS
ncbi:Ppx/GppA phosphatase [Macleaya cordata]|uniref:Ppx/GppA phosphatase n=1 Tax=Macleaya cordata TaxID=56857 RepID=A0A200R285_MACCD|nr:Ppx/GppA phosphatase [Macleaya cordata]